jgi:hypothetical protein
MDAPWRAFAFNGRSVQSAYDRRLPRHKSSYSTGFFDVLGDSLHFHRDDLDRAGIDRYLRLVRKIE